MRYLFEDYTLDTDRRELHRATDVIVVPPQVFDLLDYLIRNRARVVTKDDLINAVWNGRIVSDAALTTRLNAARTTIGDTGEKQRLIKTLPRKGFRFVGTVREAQTPADESVSSAAQSRCPMPSPTSPPRLSIVVLPFANLSGDLGQDYFVDGVTESLTTDLSRISGSFIIGRHTAFTYKGKAADLKKIGCELNVRYLLEGSVQRSGDRLRVNVQLVDAESGNHLWADRFDKRIADLFQMQDEIVSRLATALDAQLTLAEARRAERSPHPDATDLYFRGMASAFKGPAHEHLTKARAFFQEALALDPRNVGALVGLAFVDVSMGADLLTDNRAAHLSASESNAIEALSLAPNNATAHLILGYVYIFTDRAARGIAECEQALMLNSNLAGAHAAIGLAKMHLGYAAETESHALEALRFSPRDRAAYWWAYCVGMSKLQLGADMQAIEWLRRSIGVNRNYYLAHLALAAALGLVGVLDEAKAAAKIGLSLNPNFTIRRLRDAGSSTHPTYLALRGRLYAGLRLVGVPEG